MIYVLSSGSKSSSSGGLNYTVVGGTSQPTSPTENMIWVNTSTEITSHVFSIEAPASPAAGMVWFPIYLMSNTEFNALSENVLMVYPTSCRQYVGSSWVGKTAQTYQNGAWIDWSTYMIQAGVDNTDLTGGWTGDGRKWGAEGSGSTPSGSSSDGAFGIYLGANAYWDVCGSLYTVNKIDLSGLTSLKLAFSDIKMQHAGAGLYVWSDVSSSNVRDNIAASVMLNGKTSPVTLDISSLEGSYYIGFWFWAGPNNSQYIDITDLVLS